MQSCLGPVSGFTYGLIASGCRTFTFQHAKPNGNGEIAAAAVSSSALYICGPAALNNLVGVATGLLSSFGSTQRIVFQLISDLWPMLREKKQRTSQAAVFSSCHLLPDYEWVTVTLGGIRNYRSIYVFCAVSLPVVPRPDSSGLKAGASR